MRACCFAAAVVLMVLGDARVHAQNASSCPVPLDKQIEAVGAFAEMLPVFRHPRCLNCHGGLDPMSEAHPGADQLEPHPHPLVFAKQCAQCHDGLPGQGDLPGWRQPGEPVFFVGKSDEELCLQMKKFERTGDEFVEHIHNDHGGIQFIAAGFAGDRALGEGLKDYGLTIEKPPGTQAELTAKARRWVDLLGDGYSASNECGCVVKLQGKFTYTDSLTGMMSNKTTVTGNLVWKPEDGARSAPTFGDTPSVFFKPSEGEITIETQFLNSAIGSAGTCEGEGRRTFTVKQMTSGALRHMLLEIAADGRYKLTLVIPDNPDPFPKWEYAATCKFPNITKPVTQEVRYVSVIAGHQQGTMDEQGIKGRLPAPIRRGPRQINAEWTFESP